MKKALLFWIPHVLLLLMMMGSGIMYFFSTAQVAEIFTQLGYPVYTLYFNATAKILGGIAIIVPSMPRFVKEFAYAGYLFIILLALQAVVMTMPGFPWPVVISLVIWAWAYYEFRKRA